MKPNNILRQYDTGPWLGRTKDIYGRSLAYMSITNAFLLVFNAYNTMTLREEYAGIDEWLSLPLFFGIVLLGLGCTMMLVWKFELASVFRYANEQGYKHHNPIKKHLEEMEKRLMEEIRKHDV